MGDFAMAEMWVGIWKGVEDWRRAKARTYAVLNRNVWWNNPGRVYIEAENDFAAIEALLRLSMESK